MKRVDAILPAGGRIYGAFAREAGAGAKCLIEIGGSTLLERAILAARQTEFIHRIAVIGPEELVSHSTSVMADVALSEGASGPENIQLGMHWLAGHTNKAERVLILTTDLPFITPEALADFVNRCPHEADLCVPIFTRREFMSVYPGCSARFVGLKSGEWTTGCAFLVNPVSLETNWPHIEAVFASRKNQLSMARLLGAMTIGRLLTKRLDIHQVEARCREILGCTGVAVRGCDPSLAFDIDTVHDYHYAMRHCSVDSHLLSKATA